jgi:orotate phosphoribosyltransferase
VDLAEARSVLIRALEDHGLRRGQFKLKSGRTSDWFMDTKRAICRSPVLWAVAELVLAEIDNEVTAIGGLTMGADPIAFATAALGQSRGLELKAFSIRKSEKQYGQGGRVAGSLGAGDRVLVVEDTPTRGVSLLEAVKAVEQIGAVPIQTLAVLERGKHVRDVVAPLPFHALVTAPDLGLDYDDDFEKS